MGGGHPQSTFQRYVCECEPGKPALPTAVLRGPLGSLSDHEFQKLKSDHSPREEIISQVKLQYYEVMERAILNQRKSEGSSFKATLEDRRMLARNIGGRSPTLHISPASFLPEVGRNY